MLIASSYRPALRRRLLNSLLLGCGVSGALLAQPALARPSGPTVVKGTVQITDSGNLTAIRASNRSIINWQQFNIGKGETVQFIQPSATSRVLNRVTGGQFSMLEGRLTANGIVYLVNPAGVYISTGAVVNVGGLYAAAGTITDRDFLYNTNHFTNVTGNVSNQGSIQGGTVALVGSQVTNDGSIVASAPGGGGGGGGTVTMAAGQDVYLAQNGSPLVVKVNTAALAAGAAQGISNTGSINAAGGNVSLVTGDIYSLALRDSGSITGASVTLNAGANGTAQVSGSIDASNSATGATGGTVEVLGHDVDLTATAAINASGQAGGGTVLIGGAAHGAAGTPTSSTTTIASGATIHADATGNGNGGKVVVWSDQSTDFEGTITANGGATGGNGGSAEVSSKQLLAFNGSVNLQAPNGTTGTLLLDPADLEIVAGSAGSGAQDSQFISSGGTVSSGDTPSTYTISVGTLVNELITSNVVLNATSVINLNAGATISATSSSNALTFTAPTINLAANITTGGNILFNGAVVLKNDTSISSRNSTFNGTVNTDGTAGWTLNVFAGTNSTATGTVIFDNSVGAASGDALGALSANASLIKFGSTGPISIVTKENTASRAAETGNQSYTGSTQLFADATFTALSTKAPANLASGQDNITFAGTVGSFTAAGWTLTVNSPGVTWFQQSMGGSPGLALGALTITPQGGAFEATQLGNGQAQTTSSSSGTTTTIPGFAINTLENTAAKANQTGAINFGDPVVLMGDTTITVNTTKAAASLQAGEGDVTFGGTTLTNGTPWILNVTAPGVTWFKGSMGATPGDELGALNITAANGALEVTKLGNGSPFILDTVDQSSTHANATGSVSFGDNVVLQGDTTITELTTTSAAQLTATEGNLTFGGTVNTNATPWTLTVNAPGVTWFKADVGTGGAVNNTDPNALGAISINPQGGKLEQTQFGNNSAVTVVTTPDSSQAGRTGAQTYGDAIILDGNTTLQSNGGNITASGTINGITGTAAGAGFALTINAADVTKAPGTGGTAGIVKLSGAIGNASATQEPSALTVTGNTIFIGPADVAGPIVLTSSTLTDSSNKNAPEGVIELGGAINSHGKALTINTTTSVPGTATVFAAKGGSVDLESGGGALTLSPDTRLSAGGSVTINAGGGKATIGDISAGKTITVNGSSIVVNSAGDGGQFVAGTSISFNHEPGVPLNHFATGSGQSVSLGGVTQIGARRSGAVSSAKLFKTGGGPGGADTGFLLTSTGSVIDDSGPALAGADLGGIAARPLGLSPMSEGPAVDPATATELRLMGVNVRVPEVDELQATLAGDVYVDDLPTVPAEISERRDYTVDARRLSPDMTLAALNDFRDLFERQVAATTDTPAHYVIDHAKVNAVSSSLAGAIRDFRRQTQGTAFAPATFRAYLFRRPGEHRAAADNLARIDHLMTDVAAMNLSARETTEVRQRIASRLDLPADAVAPAEVDALLANTAAH